MSRTAGPQKDDNTGTWHFVVDLAPARTATGVRHADGASPRSGRPRRLLTACG